MTSLVANKKETWLRAVTAAVAIVVVALLTFVPPSTNDLWLHAAIGRIIWTQGEIPHTALFPFTEASQYTFHAHEWLSSVGLYLLLDHLGIDALVFVKGILGLALFGLCCRLSYRLTRGYTASLVLSLAVMAVANYRYYLRPELFALFFTVAVLSLLVEYRASRNWRYLAACAPVALVWANCHGSFPVALAIAAIFACGAAIEGLRAPPGARLREAAVAARPYVICTALMALAMLVNPYGLNLYRFAWDLQNTTFIRSYIYEWMPTFSHPFMDSRGFWAFVVYLALGGTVLYAGRKSVTPAGWLLLLAFGYLALGAQRHIAFFAFASIYPLSMAIAPLASRIERTPLVRGGILALLTGCAGLLVGFGNLYGGFPYYVPSSYFSPLLVEYLENDRVRGNVLNSYVLGAELVYRFYPRLRPAIDSRIDVYGEKYFVDLLRLNTDERALEQFVTRYRVDYMLLLWRDFNEGVQRMPHIRDSGWRIVFADQKVVLLGRPGSTAVAPR
ncbi:MAG: hypothetical protein WCA09_04225 [Burkholderiales bacterium]